MFFKFYIIFNYIWIYSTILDILENIPKIIYT